MTRNTRFKASLLTAGLLMAAAVALSFAPASAADALRAAVDDATLPGHRMLDWVRSRLDSAMARIAKADGGPNPDKPSSSRLKLKRLRRRCRQLAVENGLLRERLKRASRIGVSPYQAVQTESLFVPELIDATVLGRRTGQAWRSGLLLDEGRFGRVRESALVLEDDGPIVDQGKEEGLLPGQPVFCGASVLGKIHIVGRWTSTVRLVTDPEFRGKARLARRTPDGLTLGAQAILEGTGRPLCRLKFVPSDEPVRVGDEVYTDSSGTGLPWPMYYGRVVEADLPAGGNHWDIRVEPVADIEVEHVQILTKKLNPLRQLAQ